MRLRGGGSDVVMSKGITRARDGASFPLRRSDELPGLYRW